MAEVRGGAGAPMSRDAFMAFLQWWNRWKRDHHIEGRMPELSEVPGRFRELWRGSHLPGFELELRVGQVMAALGMSPACSADADARGVDWYTADGRMAVQVYSGHSHAKAEAKRAWDTHRQGTHVVVVHVRDYGGGPLGRDQLLDVLEGLGCAHRTYDVRHLLPKTQREGGERERFRRAVVALWRARFQDGTEALLDVVPANVVGAKPVWVGLSYCKPARLAMEAWGLPELSAPPEALKAPGGRFLWTEAGWRRFGERLVRVALQALGSDRVKVYGTYDPGEILAWDRWQVLAVPAVPPPAEGGK